MQQSHIIFEAINLKPQTSNFKRQTFRIRIYDMNDDFLDKKLQQRKDENAFRQLRLAKAGMVDLCSNDYLGIATRKILTKSERFWPGRLRRPVQIQKPGQGSRGRFGSTGSRLLSGNYPLIEETESFIANFHRAEAALIFNSGYDANLGLLSSIAQRGDTILYDQLSHASIRDGIRLSFAQSFSFSHNDMQDLEHKIQNAGGNIFIVTESVFSMDGDHCPLKELITISKKYEANLIVDEAHATGVIGEKGEGLVQAMGMESAVFARVHTFGKALGVHGAVVLGSEKLREYLVNFARPFIYSTALPGETVAHIRECYKLFPGMKKERTELSQLIEYFQEGIRDIQFTQSGIQFLKSGSAIQGLVIPGNEETKRVAEALQRNLLDIRPVLYPSVPKGSERLRIILHAFNTRKEVNSLLNCLKNSF